MQDKCGSKKRHTETQKNKQIKYRKETTMTFDKFTIKAQEAIQEAVNLVQARGQQAIEPEHLLAGILKVGEKRHEFPLSETGRQQQANRTDTGKPDRFAAKGAGGRTLPEPRKQRSADTGTGLRLQGRRRVRLARTDAFGFADREKYGLQNPERRRHH